MFFFFPSGLAAELDDAADPKEIYEKQAKRLLEEIAALIDDDEETWTNEAKSKDGLDIVTSKTIPNRGKVFRLTVRRTNERTRDEEIVARLFQSVVRYSATEIVKILFENQEDMPTWSPTVNECRVSRSLNVLSPQFVALRRF